MRLDIVNRAIRGGCILCIAGVVSLGWAAYKHFGFGGFLFFMGALFVVSGVISMLYGVENS